MRITGVKTFLKVSPAVLAMFAVSLASQTAQQVQVEPRNNNVRVICPPPGYDQYASQNILQNSNGTMQHTPNDKDTKFTGVGHGGPSAASHWFVFNNTHGTTETRITNAWGLSPNAFVVSTTGARNGITQSWPALGTGPLAASGGLGPLVAIASVRVHTGKVCIGIGNGPNTSCGAALSPTTSGYERLVACAPQANAVTIYSVGGPATFTIQYVMVSRAR